MNFRILVTAVVLTTTGLVTPVRSQDAPTANPAKPNQVLNACIQNQAETLPVPV
jgi:hypothetical protein